MTTILRMIRPAALALSFLLLVACSGTDAHAGRRRAVRSAPRPVPTQEWARGAVFYEIFVRSFVDSNGDGVGDFEGLISKLDYLNDGDPATTSDLGIDGLWLMPVFESPSYHGYDTVDYETIESDYGTNADFQRFLNEAHRRGIRVIIDLVVNHTSSEHPWFLESASSPTSPKRDWFVWSDVDPGWKQPWGGTYSSWHPKNGAYYYGAFWGGMPDVNYRNASAKAEMFRLARHWLAQGVNGYRLDATRYLVETGPGEAGQADTPETHQVLKELSAEVGQARPDAILVAENTVGVEALAAYFASVPMNFNFPLASAILEGIKGASARPIAETLRRMQNVYPQGVIDAPFLTNHDQTRLATVLGGHPGGLRNAAAILLTLPGAPFLYYGEEVGLQNGPTTADESKRTPMPWSPSGGFTTGTPWQPYAPGIAADNVSSQTGDPGSLLSYYRNWIAARKRSPGLLKGGITLLDSRVELFSFIREGGGERVLVIHNLSDSPVDAEPLGLNAAALEVLHADAGVSASFHSADAWRVSLPPRSSGAWRMR